MRAVVIGLHKFSDYCYGRHVTIESDHKQLEAISNKPLSEVPKRLLRMVLSIQKFDYKITYKKGSDIIIADALSRAPVEDDNFQFNFSEVNLLEFLAVSEQTRDRLVSATKEDKDLQKLIKLIKQGFPMQYKVLEPQLKHLYKFRDYLSTKDNLIFYKDRVFVPASMRNDMKKAHTSHLAVGSNMRRALDTIFWPGMRHELQECYINCKQCSRYSARNSKETLITRPLPEYPFQRIGLDTMTLDGRKYLVCVDYFSNYTLVDRLHGTSSWCTIKLIRKHFMRYGIPEEVVSDGGPEFDNKMMRELAHKYGFRWNPCSPEMPNSNGMAESAVKQIKGIKKNVIMKTAILVWPY